MMFLKKKNFFNTPVLSEEEPEREEPVQDNGGKETKTAWEKWDSVNFRVYEENIAARLQKLEGY